MIIRYLNISFQVEVFLSAVLLKVRSCPSFRVKMTCAVRYGVPNVASKYSWWLELVKN